MTSALKGFTFIQISTDTLIKALQDYFDNTIFAEGVEVKITGFIPVEDAPDFYEITLEEVGK